MSRQPELLYLSCLRMIHPPLRCFRVFRYLKTKADLNAVIDLSHLCLVQSPHVLLDASLVDIYQYGYTSEQIARAMNTDINLVALKIAHLAETGYDLCRIEHRSDFLK